MHGDIRQTFSPKSWHWYKQENESTCRCRSWPILCNLPILMKTHDICPFCPKQTCFLNLCTCLQKLPWNLKTWWFVYQKWYFLSPLGDIFVARFGINKPNGDLEIWQVSASNFDWCFHWVTEKTSIWSIHNLAWLFFKTLAFPIEIFTSFVFHLQVSLESAEPF